MGGLLFLALLEIFLTDNQFSVREHRPAALLGALLMCGGLWWRREQPLVPVVAALAGVTATASAGVVPQAWLLPLLCLVAYSVGANGHGWESPAGLAGSVLAGWVIASSAVDGSVPIDYIWTVAMVGISWAAGASMRRRQEWAAHDRAAALAEQRARIARELHDVVAHSLTVVVMTADAAEMSLRRDRPLTVQPLQSIRRVAQEALAEMRRLVGILRVDDAEPTGAQPGLTELPALVETMRASGLPVVLSTEGDVSDLPPGIHLTAYRIVQEALTNARRHAAAGCSARVTVRRDSHCLTVEVVNDGETPQRGRWSGAVTAGSGRGLLGLRERVAMYAGSFEAAPLAGGGYRVAAALPLTAPLR